jgi:hypothetical protein
MARISAQNTKVYIGDGTAAVVSAVSAVTKAAPAVATLADVAGITKGDLIVLDKTGLKSVDGRVFIVGTIDATAKTVELVGSDASAEAAAATAGEATAHGAQEVCLTTFSRNSPAAAQIDVTTLCDEARRRVAGIPDSGTFRFDGFYDSTDTGYAALRGFYAANENRPIAIVPRDGSMLSFTGSITALSETFGVDQAVAFSGEGLVDGPVSYAKPPAPAAVATP